MKLLDVLYVPTLPVNLVSAYLLRKRGIYFSNLDNTLRLVSDHREIGYAPELMGLNMIQLAPYISSGLSAFPVIAETRPDALLWHQRLGHAGMSLLEKTQANSKGMEGTSLTESMTCEPCSLAKSQRIISRRPSERATQLFGRIHIDAVGHITPELATGEKWVIVLTDDLTRHRWDRVTRTKGEAYDVIKWFINLVKVHHTPFRILEIVLDGGREFGGRQFDLLAQKESIIVKKSSDYTPEQNGTAESSNKVIITRARLMMIDSGLPDELWPEAVNTAVYVTNRTST
jgi:hypothetical protein